MEYFTKIPEHLVGSTCKDDASKWAAAFCQSRDLHGWEPDEAMMLGWFANAIEIAHDYRTRPRRKTLQ